MTTTLKQSRKVLVSMYVCIIGNRQFMVSSTARGSFKAHGVGHGVIKIGGCFSLRSEAISTLYGVRSTGGDINPVTKEIAFSNLFRNDSIPPICAGNLVLNSASYVQPPLGLGSLQPYSHRMFRPLFGQPAERSHNLTG